MTLAIGALLATSRMSDTTKAWIVLDPAHEVPPTGLLPARTTRRIPYLYSGADITALLAGAADLDPPAWDERAQGVVRQDHYSVVSMDNSKLLRCNSLDRVTEHLGVLESHVREQNHPRVEDVRGVVSSAETCLDHGDIGQKMLTKAQIGRAHV